MNYNHLKNGRVLEIFEKICAIPHGSENCEQISLFCINFAEKLGLKQYTDDVGNVVIYKDGTKGLENASPIILQGHLDMVCQKEASCNIDFLNDGITITTDGDFISAKGTTLGADNGIAVAMILAILESDDIKHPPIEAVFTTDEEIGMIGAGKLDMSVLTAKRMINIDSEEENVVTVSCAGGSEITAKLPVKFSVKTGCEVTIELNGLKGGHSGVEINSGRVNSNILAGRILNYLSQRADFELISVSGGDKGNAIANNTSFSLLSLEPFVLYNLIEELINDIYDEICSNEPEFYAVIGVNPVKKEYKVFDTKSKNDIIYLLGCIPNGVQEMSGEIKNLVETSLNLGIVKSNEDGVSMLVSLRSNKKTSLFALEDKLKTFFAKTDCNLTVSGFYPPWEYNRGSEIRERYIEAYKKIVGKKPKVAAIHAGLECAIFASKISDIDCIAIGPNMFDVHTVNEKLSVSSTMKIFEILLEVLKNL